MTKMEAVQRVVVSCDKHFEADLANAEVLLVDLGGTPEEITAAIGPSGFVRAMLWASRNEQIAETAAWLTGSDNTLH
jgi:hypothetical protein